MIYGYIRVSTDKQTVENQRFEINNFLKLSKISKSCGALQVVVISTLIGRFSPPNSLYTFL